MKGSNAALFHAANGQLFMCKLLLAHDVIVDAQNEVIITR